MDKERALLLNAILQGKSQLESIFNDVMNPPKSENASEIARRIGNGLLLQQRKHDPVTHEKIFNHYCKSIALAPIESETLAFAYGNRSYLLLHMQNYKDCIRDIDYALKIAAISNELKAKLLCRKAKCMIKLGIPESWSVLQMSESFIDKINGRNKERLVEMINAVKTLVINNEEEEERNNTQVEDVPLTEDYMSRVKIQYNEEYGRHLIAAKDYNPGDIILVEKIYASALTGRSYTYCHYCLKPVWSSVPCNYCSLTMFCDEICREKAWNEFHDIECSLMSHLKSISTPSNWEIAILYVRTWITGMKEIGDIAKLKEKLGSVDTCTDICSKGFFENDRLVVNSIQNIYSLQSNTDSPPVVEIVNDIVPSILILFIKYCKMEWMEEKFDINNVEDLMNNEDILFLGSLLIRVLCVHSLYGICYGCEVIDFEKLENRPEHVDMIRREFITPLSSLINHSCFPTAAWRYLDSKKFLLFAMQPIKKDSQIFISYGKSFYRETQIIRQDRLWRYNFVCNCQACTEQWQPIVNRLDDLKTGDNDEHTTVADVVITKYRIIEHATRDGKIDEKHIKMLSTLITLTNYLQQPALDHCLLLDLLDVVFERMYLPKKPSFDKCDG